MMLHEMMFESDDSSLSSSSPSPPHSSLTLSYMSSPTDAYFVESPPTDHSQDDDDDDDDDDEDGDYKSNSSSSFTSPSPPKYPMDLPLEDGDFLMDSSLPGGFPMDLSPPPDYLVEPPSPSSSLTESTTSSSSPGSPYSRGRRFSRRGRRRHYFHVLEEEKSYYDADEVEADEKRKEFHFWCISAIFAIAFLFVVFCCIVFSASKPYKVRVLIQSLEVKSMYYGEGSDLTGVPTKFLTANCSTSMIVANPATFFGVHIRASPLVLSYSGLAIATGQVDKFYQPRKSSRIMKVGLLGYNVPLYGSAIQLQKSDRRGGIPLKLKFDVYSTAYLIGSLVKTQRTRRISCSLVIKSRDTKKIIFDYDSCEYF